MSKQGMKRPQRTHTKERNPDLVPEIQGKAKSSKVKANPIIVGTHGATQKVYHAKPVAKAETDKPIPDVYPEIDNDLARDNMENDIPEADLQDL